mgnify:CR=1 FL=1
MKIKKAERLPYLIELAKRDPELKVGQRMFDDDTFYLEAGETVLFCWADFWEARAFLLGYLRAKGLSPEL